MLNDNPVLTARKSLELTQTEMAQQLGVNISSIVRWEKGHLPVSQRTRLAVASLVERHKTEVHQ